MDENYIDIVRKSLYKDQNQVGNSRQMPRTSKKIKFSVDHYNSETVFEKSDHKKSEKLRNRKSTPFKKKDLKKKKAIQNGDSSFEDETKFNNQGHKFKYHKPTPIKDKLSKKRKVVISFDSNESFEEDLKDDIIPSKSEIDLSNTAFNKTKSVKKKNIFEDSDSEESVAEFNLNNYFKTRDISFNESSIIDTHSGIEYEFVSDYAEDCRIVSSDLASSQPNEGDLKKEPECVADTPKDVIEIAECDLSDIEYVETNDSILEVSSKLEESLTFNDEQIEPVTNVSTPLNGQLQDLVQDEEYYADYTKESRAEYYDLEDWKLVILKEYQSVSFHGLFTLKILYGKVEIFGHILDEHSEEINLYSPRGSALLSIKNITETGSNESRELFKIVPSFTFDDTTSVKENSAVFKCTKLDDVRMPFIEKYISQQIFPIIFDNNSPRVVFEPRDTWNVFKESYMFNEILNSVEPSSKLLLAGGKSVGKSTFLRFGINRLLNKFDKVRVIDLDPGQSEFAVPGCISIVSITKPIFGPNYTHLKTTDRSFLSNINVGFDPGAYIKCVKHLYAYLETLEECPTLINYMGFSQGIGLKIISSAITYIQPTDIVQIQSKRSSKNFKVYLTPQIVQENCNLFPSNLVSLNYKLHTVPAMNDNNEGWVLEPRQSREMCVLAYLGGMMHNGINSLISHELPMYEIKLSNVRLSNLQGEDVCTAIANANLVALCSLEAGINIFKCYGYGIVRGIDLETRYLVLLTPETLDILDKVYHLVIGSAVLPPSVYMTPDDVRGSIPYVMKGALVSLGQITKRSYLPVNKK